LSGVAMSAVESVKLYFERLFSAVAAFIPLGAAMYAMGGNLTSAASSTATLSVTLAVCEFLCGYTVIPVFCICLCTSLLSVFGGASGALGGTVSGAIRKWYTTAMAFVMMILTGAISSQSILSSKADTAAMRGAKFAVSSFVPLFGGTLSGTLGTLSSSVELLRGSVGIIGIAVIFLMLLPIVIELALMRAVFSVGSFCAGLVGIGDEQRIMNDIGSLYGYLEGAALLCSSVFVIAMGIFAASVTPFS
jgi:stage III sporulation protein AE